MQNQKCFNVVVHFPTHYLVIFDEDVTRAEAEAAVEDWVPSDPLKYERMWEWDPPKDRPTHAQVIN
jgi:hypothetical protein